MIFLHKESFELFTYSIAAIEEHTLFCDTMMGLYPCNDIQTGIFHCPNEKIVKSIRGLNEEEIAEQFEFVGWL